jgi:hypothetical protein
MTGTGPAETGAKMNDLNLLSEALVDMVKHPPFGLPGVEAGVSFITREELDLLYGPGQGGHVFWKNDTWNIEIADDQTHVVFKTLGHEFMHVLIDPPAKVELTDERRRLFKAYQIAKRNGQVYGFFKGLGVADPDALAEEVEQSTSSGERAVEFYGEKLGRHWGGEALSADDEALLTTLGELLRKEEKRVAGKTIEVNIPAPQVTVNVPKQPAPQVTVQLPEPQPRVARVERDASGRIKGIVSE